MKNFGGIGLAWFLATVVAVTVAAAAVGSVRSVVTDVPTALGVSALPVIAQGETAGILGSPSDASVLDQAVTTSTVASIVETVTTDPQEAEMTTATAASQPVEQVVLAQDHPEREEEKKSRPQGGSTPSETYAPSEPSGTPVTTTSKPTAPATTDVTTTTAPQTATTTPPPPPPPPPLTTTTTTTPPPPPPPPPPTTTTPTTPTIFIPESPSGLTTTATQHDSKTYTRIIDTDGGSLSVRVSGDSVVFRRAYPKNGWTFDLADGGPEVVVARFTRTDDGTTRINVVATVIAGNLEVSITQPN